MLGNLKRNAQKVEALSGGEGDVVVPHRRSFASLAVAAVADERISQAETRKMQQRAIDDDSEATSVDGSLDMEMVRWVCGRIDLSVMCRCAGDGTGEADEADPQAALLRVERSLALVDLGIGQPALQRQNSSVDLENTVVQRVLAFCEPPALVAVAGSCQQLRRCVLDGTWRLWEAMMITHIAVSVKELELVAITSQRAEAELALARARSADKKAQLAAAKAKLARLHGARPVAPATPNPEPDSSDARVASLLRQTKALLHGLDEMDLVTASLSKRPTALLELVCDALCQLLTPPATDTDTVVTAAKSSLYTPPVEHSVGPERRSTSLAFLFKPDSDVYRPGNGVQRRRGTWAERSNSIETASVSMASARPTSFLVENTHRGSSFRGRGNRPGSDSSFFSDASSTAGRPPRPGSTGSYLSNFSKIDMDERDGETSPFSVDIDMSHSLLALDSTQAEDSVPAPSHAAARSWWTPGGDYGGAAAAKGHSVVGSRWDLGRKALRTMVSTRLLELGNPGAGAGFHSLMGLPDEMRSTVRGLLPYTATLLAELDRLRVEQRGPVHGMPVLERVSVGLACFVVATDAQLRVWAGMRNEGAAVLAEARAARVAEMAGRLQLLV